MPEGPQFRVMNGQAEGEEGICPSLYSQKRFYTVLKCQAFDHLSIRGAEVQYYSVQTVLALAPIIVAESLCHMS